MSARIRNHIRSNIIGYVCLFWLMTGTAYAAVIVDSNSDVARDTISGHNPPTGDHSNLIAGSVDAADLANGSVNTLKLAANAATGAKVDESTLDSNVLQRRVGDTCPAREAIRAVSRAGGVTCEAVGGSGEPSGPASGDLTGDYPGPAIAPGAVNSPKVADNSLTGADIDESSLVGVQKGAGTDEVAHKLLTPGLGNFLTFVLLPFQHGSLLAYCQVDSDGTTVAGLQVDDEPGAPGPLMVSLSVFQEPSSNVISNEVDINPSTTTALFGTTQADSHSEILAADRFPASDTSFRLARMSAQIKVNQGAQACRFWGEGSVYG